MINKEKIKDSFNKSSTRYNNYANVQLIMANKLIDMIKKGDIKNILEIGCGTGSLTNKILDNFKNINLTVIDLSENMITETKKNLSKKGRSFENINFICGDGETIKLNEKFDLIISNATFQWFNFFRESIEKYTRLLKENGQLLVSTFGEDTFIELELSSVKAFENIDTNQKYQLRRSFLNKEKIEKILEDISGNEDVLEDKVREYHKDAKCFLKSVKNIGAGICSREKVITPPKLMKKILDIYDEEYRKGEFVYATYHCIYISVINAS